MAITKATASSVAPAAKGDLVVGSGTNDAAVLGVGSANQVLTVDSSTGTGLKWAAASTPTYVGVSAYKNANQTVSNATFTAITFQVEDFDTDAFHSTVTNTSRFTIPTGKGGKYLINGVVQYAHNATGTRLAALYKNGSAWSYLVQTQTVTTSPSGIYLPVSFVINLAAADYVEIFAYQTSGGDLTITQDGTLATNIQVSYLGA